MTRMQRPHQPVCLNVFVEDDLGAALIRRIIQEYGDKFAEPILRVTSGFGAIKRQIQKYNEAARRCPMLICTDLDNSNCAPAKIAEWLPNGIHPNLMLRIAVREVESWVMADRETFAGYLHVPETIVPVNPEAEPDPKKRLIDIARRSRKRTLREALVPKANSQAKVGRDYNGTLIQYVQYDWRPSIARTNSDSLDRTMRRLASFQIQ